MEELIRSMRSAGILRSRALEAALRSVPRELFVQKKFKRHAYFDEPLPIGWGQTISQPSTVVLMTEALDVKRGQKILEIGAGSGWQAAILAKLVGPRGHVWSIERIAQLAAFARANLRKAGIKNVDVIVGDGSRGLPEHAPFDRIIITAACPDVPEPLLKQLKRGGKLVAPIGDIYIQEVYVITKRNGLEKSSLGQFRFVPLIGAY